MTTNKPGRLNALMLALAPVFFERRQRALQRLAAMAAEKANRHSRAGSDPLKPSNILMH